MCPLPEREIKFATSVRISGQGGSPDLSSPSSTTPYTGPKPVGEGFILVWSLFRIAVWVTIVVWINPHLLDFVGGRGIARWLMDHTWVRWLGALPLLPLGLISAFEVLNDPKKRAAREELASTVGASVVEVRGLDPTFGIADGPGLSLPLGHWSAVVGTWKQRNKSHTVATVQVPTRSTFSFIARGTDREPAMLRGLQQFAMGQAVRQMTERADNPASAAAAATLATMNSQPLTTGDETLDRTIVLRTNQPDAARALFREGAMVSAIQALNAQTRSWDWTLYPTATAGMAEMRLECPGGMSDADSLRIVQTLLRTSLVIMENSGLVAA